MTISAPNNNRGSGLTQATRFPAALASDYALVDERGVEHLLEFGRRYAKFLKFCEVDGSSGKDWSLFFENDFCFLLAEICVAVETPSPLEVVRAYNLDVEIEQELEVIYSLLSCIDQWQRRASAIDNAHLERTPNQLTLSLRALIAQDLSFILNTILKNASWKTKWDAIAQERKDNTVTPIWYADAIWKLNSVDHDDDVGNAITISPQSGLNYLQSTEKDVRFQYGKLGKLAKEYLTQNFAPTSADDDLSDQADHAPHVALYAAFLQLMQVLRDDMNSYTERHLDCYYRDILRLSEDPGKADSASVMFTLAPGVVNHFLPSGTALAGGKDESGDDILFLTDNDLSVNRASIAGLRTLYSFRETAPANSADQAATTPRMSGKPRWVRRVWAAMSPSTEDGRGQPLTRKDLGWPAFGNFNYDNLLDDSQSDLLASYDKRVDYNHQAVIGALITSEALLLQEGERQVRLTFRCQNNSDANDLFNNLLERYQPGSSRADATTRASAINTIFQAGWQVYVSTAKEWFLVSLPQFTSGADAAGVFLEAVITLSAGDPATAPNPKLPEVPDSLWPSVKLMVNPTANLYLYSFFAQLQVSRVDIAVGASGIGNVSLQGNLGPIASGKPFAAFGAMPVVGNYFQVAHAELGKPGLQTAAVSINWQPLPDNLKTYYAGYGTLDFDSARFMVDLTLPLDGEWHAATTSPVPLFGADLKMSELSWVPPVQSGGGPFAAAVGVPPGSVRIALASPSYAFGHADYPNIFAAQALNNAARVVQSKGESGTLKFDAINPPVTPTVKSISLAYTATDSIDLSNMSVGVPVAGSTIKNIATGADGGQGQQLTAGKYRYIYPFGCGVPQMNNPTVMPPDDGGSDGHLYIGIAGLDLRTTSDPNAGVDIGCRIVLHFQFCEQVAAEYKRLQVAPQPRDIDTAISWRYLSNNTWKSFDKSSLVSYTKDFQISGLVLIDLPPDITDQNTIMPNGMIWIEAGAVGEVCDALIVDILPNAITATRTVAPSGQASLPPASISGFQKKIAKVKTVLQPYATIGGRVREKKPDAHDTQQYRARISERLKHKQRASQPGDYEKLALNQFPQLSQAKCVTANNSRGYDAQGRVAPGEVLLVVLPQMSDLSAASADGAISPPLPISKQVMGEIGAYLQQCASPFVRTITVRNPVYRCLKVTVHVRFRNDGKFGGYVPRLNAAISDFIAPWLRDLNLAVTLGGGALHIEKLNSAIVNLPYVEKVWRDSLSVKFTDAAGEPNRDLIFSNGVAVPDTPWTVFVPYAKHAIITQQVETKPLPQPAPVVLGIGLMTVGGDFIVGAEAPVETLNTTPLAAPKPYQLIIPHHLPRPWR